MSTILPFHPLANIFPLVSPQEIAELGEDIKANGLTTPIVMYQGQILDGRNRYHASVSSSVEPTFTEYEGTSPSTYVLSLNLHRRHLNASQKATVAVEILPHLEQEAKERKVRKSVVEIIPPQNKGKARDIAAKALDVNPRYIQDAKTIKEKAPELFDRIKHGEIKISDANREIVKREHAKKVQAAKAAPQKAYNGPYDLILADPPWQYEPDDRDNSRGINNHYNTLPVEDIYKHSEHVHGTKDSILLLWATATKMPEAIQVMQAWGYKYVTHAIWDKQIIGMGHWFRIQHELLLVGTKGKAPCPIPSQRISSVVSEKRTQHSKKPECVYQWIEETFPDLNKLEMYCRSPRKGWSVWGNEV